MKKIVYSIAIIVLVLSVFHFDAQIRSENLANLTPKSQTALTQSAAKLGSVQTKVTEQIQMSSNENILTILQKLFPTFYGLVRKAGFASKVENAAGITIFAPTEEAFKKFIDFFGSEAYDELINVSQEKLQNMVMLYIVPNREMAHDLTNMITIQPYQGKPLTIQQTNGKLEIGQEDQPNQAVIVHADIIGNNGIVHGIDSVLLP